MWAGAQMIHLTREIETQYIFQVDSVKLAARLDTTWGSASFCRFCKLKEDRVCRTSEVGREEYKLQLATSARGQVKFGFTSSNLKVVLCTPVKPDWFNVDLILEEKGTVIQCAKL